MAKRVGYIFVSGGVISGLGKGITAASLGALIKSRGYKVTTVKCDPYLNVDAGTIRPQEHGEVFVTKEGMECDQDIGNYERFLHENLTRYNYITNGQIYQEIIRRERNLEYDGEDVEVVPHVPEEIIRRIKLAQEKTDADIVITEIGGTVGEYQNVLFIEANRIMEYRMAEEVIHIHVGYLPIPKHLGEMKSKPIQTSIRTLNASGIQPDFVVGRSEQIVDEPRKFRISWLCNVDKDAIISNPDMDSPYKLPLVFDEQKFDAKVLEKLGFPLRRKNISNWRRLKKNIDRKKTKKIKLAIVGKYFDVGGYKLTDSYISVIEAIKHASWELGIDVGFGWFESEEFEINKANIKKLEDYSAIIVPGGFGSRGVEGKINAIQFARENKIPYLGLCYGMQLAVVEFARNELGMKGANTTEVDQETKYPVIDLMKSQKENIINGLYGGTMRLGNWKARINMSAISYNLYKKYKWLIKGNEVLERHRHRYEFNDKFKEDFEKKGVVFSGINPDTSLVEVYELDKSIHPYFIGTQYHPELASKPFRPHPLFLGLLESAINSKQINS